MAGVRLKKAIVCAVAINLLLLTIGITLRTALRPARVCKAWSDVDDTVLSTSKLPPTSSKKAKKNTLLKQTEDSYAEFTENKWGEPFLPGGQSAFDAWRSLLPKTSSQKPDFVLGVPTISRKGKNYFESTLHSLIQNLGSYRNVVIVVYVGEENKTVASEIRTNIQKKFSAETKEGLIQVIAPPADYYPNWNSVLRQNFGDSFQRVKWRSKQVLDQIFLMMHAYNMEPKYYLMLEDDVIAAKEYLSKIFLDAESKAETKFVLINYCGLGAIGKLFRREILLSMASYFSLFWSDKPLDWLLFDYVRTLVCGYGKAGEECSNKVKEVSIDHKPSLFQHVGTESSFREKISRLKDDSFRPE